MSKVKRPVLKENTQKKVEFGMARLRDILRDASENYERNSDINQAAAIAFYAILSLLPFFLLTVVAAGYFFGIHPHIQKDIVQTIKGIHPFFSEDIFTPLLQANKKRHLLGGVGIITLFWFSAMIFGALEKAFNIIFRVKTVRNFIGSKLLAFAMIPLGWIIGVTSMGITYLAAVAAKQTLITGYGFSYGYAFFSRYFLSNLLTIAFITLLYRIIPNVKVSLRGALGGAVIFSALLEAAKYFFTWYIKNYTHYDLIFGSMETVVLLVIWVFYVAIIFLFCAEIISSYERRDLILLEGAFLKRQSKSSNTHERLFRKFGTFYPQGSYLFREGDSGREMFYIITGKIRIEKKAGQVSKVLAEVGSGSYLGEMAALVDAPRTASAIAVDDCHVAVISGNMFRDMIRESEGVSMFMLREFSHRIMHTNAALEELTQAWIKLLVVFYFLKEWPIPENLNILEELAVISGKTTLEIAEVFNWLSGEGILDIHDGRVIGFRQEQIWRLLDSRIKS